MQHLDLKTSGYLVCTAIHDLRDYAIIPNFFNATNISSLTLLSDSPYTWKTYCWIQILKLQILDYLWFISSYNLEVVDNYNKEKVNVTTKTFPLFQRQCLLIEWIYLYISSFMAWNFK